MRRLWETAIIFTGTLGWWGFVYPELCLAQEVCEEAEAFEETAEEGFGEKICIKSRLVEYILSEEPSRKERHD